ncbi:hypothetical protein LTR36_000941 [Oleoguttula mirabilis]|uniref:Mediator of RNA polymerase II transcription subunit 19 n=1 Tax=Oleoguttula mirabilis TaxID=1507867 RepID=A0AAV9JPC9_9PEZI|nr:hypothetical protein LTR36_000941 [Oleoguttula mirabilis]
MSPDGERSPKRQRLGSYSPASPPIAETKGFVHPPQTPPPSVHMSPSWQSQAQTAEQQSGPGSVTFPTPPSTAGFPGQQRSFGGAEDGAESGQHTPVLESEPTKNGDTDAEMQDGGDDGPVDVAGSSVEGDVNMEGAAADAEHRRTDHERQEDPPTAPAPPPPQAPRLYKLHTEPIAPSRPHPSQNFMTLYGLQRIQASVARKDAAGNKINRLRKSYEGKVKALGLEGRSKATANNGALQGLLDPNWDADVGGGVTWWQQEKGDPLQSAGSGVAMTELLAKLDVATSSMRPGQLPKSEHKVWKDMLAVDDTAAKGTPATHATKLGLGTHHPALLAKTSAGVALRASAPSSPRNAFATRPERANKKRRYDDSSFDGYQQTFDEDGGYSTGGVDEAGGGARRGSGGKRQKVEQAKRSNGRVR